LGPSHEALFEPYKLKGEIMFDKFKKPVLLFLVCKRPFLVEQTLTDGPCDPAQIREARLEFSKAHEYMPRHFVHY
jgi:hypothetical protein